MKINKKLSFVVISSLIIFSIICNSQFYDLNKIIPYFLEIISFRRQHNNPFSSFQIVYDTITQDALASIVGTSSNGSTQTLTMTIGNNPNRALFVYNYLGNAVANDIVTSVKIGTTSFTLAASESIATSGSAVNIYYLANPPTGSQTITVSYSTTGKSAVINALSLYNVDQISVVGATNTQGSLGSSSPTGTVTPTIKNSWILDALMSQNGPPTATLTQLFNTNSVGSGYYNASQYKSNPTIGSSNSMAWTVANEFFNWVGIEILAHHS